MLIYLLYACTVVACNLLTELAYGDSQRSAEITPGSVLIFTLQMLKILDNRGNDL
jgi:hypothetical protein